MRIFNVLLSFGERKQNPVFVMVWVFLFIVTTGLAVAGLVRSGWQLVTGGEVGLNMLGELTVLSPLKGIVLVVSAPVMLLAAAAGEARRAYPDKLKILLAGVIGIGHCFVQGATVLSVLGAV